jgi:carboxyl-terminal processing protease
MQRKNIFILLIIPITFVFGFLFGNKERVQADEYWFNSKSSSISSEDFELFWKALIVLDKKHPDAKDISSEERVWAAIQGLTSSYGDPYTTFFNPEEMASFDEDINGEFSGVGMEVGLEDGYVTVIAPLKDSPAEKAGIRAGDVVTKINDESTLDMTIDQAVEKIRGPKGEIVRLTIARNGEGELIELEIVRDTIELTTIETSISPDDKNIFIISMYNFSEDSSLEFNNAIQEFIKSGKKKLILDLRSNPGGYLTSAVDISSVFVPQGKVVVTESFSDSSEKEDIIYRSKGTNLKLPKDMKMVILVDKGSASASEIVAGALQEYKIATLIGTKTFGKGSVQEYLKLDNDTAIKVTVARWLTPLGNSIEESGLTPDYIVEYDSEAEKDSQIQAAVEILNKR